jgi:KipI family sensor histidine kinase inhibitor
VAARLDVRAYGDAGVLAGVLGEDYESRWRTTQALATAVRAARPRWLVDLVATYDQLFVAFDPGLCDHAAVEALISRLNDDLENPTQGACGMSDARTFEVPVLFGGAAGPDLEAVAAELDLSPVALVVRLTSASWRVRFVASPVGTPFTDTPTWNVSVPRMQQPRVAVPGGSIALSGSQSIIYPVTSPGGWRLVGRTPLRIIDLARGAEGLVPYRAGDLLKYLPIDAARFAELEQQGGQLGAGS